MPYLGQLGGVPFYPPELRQAPRVCPYKTARWISVGMRKNLTDTLAAPHPQSERHHELTRLHWVPNQADTYPSTSDAAFVTCPSVLSANMLRCYTGR